MDDALTNSLIQTVKNASTSLATAKVSNELANDALEKAQDLVIKTQSLSSLLSTAGTVFGAAAAVSGANYQQGAAYTTQRAFLDAQVAAQAAAYKQLIEPNTTNSIALQQANQALQAAQAAAEATALAAVTLPEAVEPTTGVAIKALDQAASAVVAPSFSTHPYLMFTPVDSTLVPKSNLAYDSAEKVAANIPYDATATTAPSYLLANLGTGYFLPGFIDPNGVAVISLREQMNDAITKSDSLVDELVNAAIDYDSSGIGSTATAGAVSAITDSAIVSAVGQVATAGDYATLITTWKTLSRTGSSNVMMPATGTSLTVSNYATRAETLSKGGAALISAYQSGGVDNTSAGNGLACGLASAAATVVAAVYPVTQEELTADIAENPFDITPLTDIYSQTVTSGAYNGITPPLVNLRNIYANTTLMTHRTNTAVKAAKDSKDAFMAWHNANEYVTNLNSEATNLYNSVPAPSTQEVLEMDAKLLDAKTKLSSATYALGVAENYAVTTARLAQQSASSTSVFMGNTISTTFDQLGNLNSVSSTDPSGTQGANNANCPLLAFFGASGTNSANALRAAQALAQAAANDNYVTTTVNTISNHTINGQDSSSNATFNLTGTKLLVQDAQYAAAGASAQVANVAFADATESVSRFTDWHNVCLAANSANAASAAVYRALNDASNNNFDGSGTEQILLHAVDSITQTVRLLISATTPFNQQATTSATLATNNVVALAARLENVKNVCVAAQTAIQLAASTYDGSGNGSNIAGSANGQGGSIFTVNMAYAKVTANAAQAACTAAAILAREQAVLAARRANYSALALKNLVGDAVLGEAIAGFLDASGNLVSQTGYGKDSSNNSRPLLKASGYAGTNGIKPPSVTASTILYQGQGGLNLDTAYLDSTMNPQPSIITNLAYTTSTYSNVYSATSGLVTAAQAVLTALDSDSSGNPAPVTALELTYPNVNAVNSINSTLGQTGGAGLVAVQNCLLAAYEAQQWVVASANATFVTFGYSPQNVNLVTFTPTLLGVINKLVSDADACLDTVLTAESAILYALTLRTKRLLLHDVDAANFAAAFNANQSAADTYLALTNAAKVHNANTRMTIHFGDLTNALSPLAATATIAAAQAAALGGMAFSPPTANSNLPSTNALKNANFPNSFSTTNKTFAAGAWGSASLPAIGYGGVGQNNNSLNPNAGPYNGTATGAAPFPAFNASSSSRIAAPAAEVLQYSSQLLKLELSNAALTTAKAASLAAESITDFNNLMVKVSTITPSLVDAATSASNLTLAAAQSANYATSLQTQGQTFPNQASLNTTANLLVKEYEAILAAKQSAHANLDAITPSDARYASRKNMLKLWDIALDAIAEVVDASDGGPTKYASDTDTSNNFPGSMDPRNIKTASLGSTSIMGTAPMTGSWSNTPGIVLIGNSAPVYYVKVGNVERGSMEQIVYTTPDSTSTATLQPTLLAKLNAAVINAYNATTGAPTPDSSGNYRYIQFLDESNNVISNFPENVNDTKQAYNNAVAALIANAAVANPSIAAVQAAALRIRAAYEAAVEVAAGPPALPATLPARVTSGTNTVMQWTGFTRQQAAAQVAVDFWASANAHVANMLIPTGTTPYPNLTLENIFKLQAIVGLNFTKIVPKDTTSGQLSYANAANIKQEAMLNDWSQGLAATWGVDSSGNPAYGPTTGLSLSTNAATILAAVGLGSYTDASGIVLAGGVSDFLSRPGIATGDFKDTSNNDVTPTDWGAYFWTKAISVKNNELSGIALQAATDAWNAVQTLLNSKIIDPLLLDYNAANATIAKAKAIYSVKIALQSAARASASGQVSATATNSLATATNSYEDLAAFAASEAAYASTANLNMYRCVPDIAMHANADDLPVIFKLNGSAVYVGGTSIATSMFAGFLGVVQSHNPINYFVNPLMYDNYTYPSPLFNDISGSSQVWYPNSVGGYCPSSYC